jgi:hypothetical protein
MVLAQIARGRLLAAEADTGGGISIKTAERPGPKNKRRAAEVAKPAKSAMPTQWFATLGQPGVLTFVAKWSPNKPFDNVIDNPLDRSAVSAFSHPRDRAADCLVV